MNFSSRRPSLSVITARACASPMRRIDRRRHPIAERDHRGLTDPLVGELLDARRARGDRDGGGEVDAELAFETGLRRSLAGQFEHERMHGQVDAIDRVGREMVRGPQLQTGVDDRMQHDAARERLVGVQENLVALAEAARDLRVVARGAEHVRPAGPPFEARLRCW